ncbi:uncharacterized protein F4822DRAFT_433043 [Hypoxylon trugodes]|uniref:uncharacterized protein n=1 Tax=Hypoxylon trugodes TaxID=326681 RepID=UPI00219FD43A|nr:uncharacterized protein F4822DRAFT_433043 [Hypoxylon trugodes]KAI1384499.1 hypothetical protein F4822DRAFT_433043 [Hypoxylon trugodes]
MSSRALCGGGALASRTCPSLSPRANLVGIEFGISSARSGLLVARSMHFLSATSSEKGNGALSAVRYWPGDRVRRRTDLRSKLDDSAITIWPGFWSRRCLSQTTRPLKEDSRSKSKDQAPQAASSSSSLPAANTPLKGIRKVIPKVLPASLTSLTPHENIYTVPNLLTFSRLVAAPFIGYAILHDAHGWALGLFAYAGASDLLDGWIARRWKLQTVVGSVVDPMADKTLMTVLTVCLAVKGALPVWLAAIILGRDVGLGIAAIYYRWISLPPPKTFARYWDFSLPSAEVRPTTISKYNTFLQLGLMGATMVTPVVTADVGLAMSTFQYLVATTTAWSGLSYVFSKDAVRILSENKDKPK